MKKFNEFDKKTVESTDDKVLENFTENLEELDKNVKNSDQALGMFENVISELDSSLSENFVQKKDVTNFFKSQIVSLKDQFENLKSEILNLNDHQKNELLGEVNLILKNANNVIEKVDSESKIYKEKYFNDTIVTEVKLKDIDKKLDDLNYENVIKEISKFKDDISFFREVTENKLPLQDKKINKINFESEQESNRIKKLISDILLEFEQKIKTNNEELSNNFTSFKDNISKLSSDDIAIAKKDFLIKLKELKVNQLNGDKELKKTFNEEFKIIKKDVKSADTKINKQLNKYKLLDDKTKILMNEVKLVFKDKRLTDINKKVKFIEETLEKFNEKNILTENIVNVPTETNKDPLTPLNQNYVTFDQLKKHYQLFINRVQQQLMSVGGGGAVRIDQLDDVDHNSVLNAQNGQALVFITEAEGGNNKFEVRTVATSGGGGGGVTSIGGATGAVGNIILGRMVNDSGALTISNIAGYHANLESELTTANVGELTNLYFTDVRARNALAANIDTRLTIANVSGYHANLESELTTANVAELTNLYYTDGRFDTRFATKDTDDLSEGSSNEYFTQSRARGSVSTAAGARAYNSGTGVITIPGTSDHVSEGTTNLFFSDARANAALQSNLDIRLTTANVSELTNLYYTDGRFDTRFATKDTDDLSEGSTNEYFTQARARGSVSKAAGSGAYNSGTGVITIPATSAHITEDTNLFFTDARSRAAISKAAGSGAYNSSTGVITIPGTSDHVTEGTTNLFFSNTRANGTISANVQHSLVRSMTLAASDETTDLTTGTGKVTFRTPFAMTLPATPLPRISVQTAPVGSTLVVDINEGGSTILSTKLTIDASEKTSKTAATPCVVSDASIADDSEITVDIDQVGSSTAGKGLKLTLYYTVTE